MKTFFNFFSSRNFSNGLMNQLQIIDNFVCDIDIMHVNCHQDRTIIFRDICYTKFSYFTKSFSLSHDN